MSAPLYLFAHLPKTAGQSVTAHVLRHIPNRERSAARFSRVEAADPAVLEDLLARRDALTLVYGHRVSRRLGEAFAPRPLRPVVVLREPVAYLQSLFNYLHQEAGHRPDTPETQAAFWKWTTSVTNQQACWLVAIWDGQGFKRAQSLDKQTLRDTALRIIERFWCVGDQRDLDGTLAPFFRALGIDAPLRARLNRSGKDYQRLIRLDAEGAARLAAMSPIDVELHARFAGQGVAAG